MITLTFADNKNGSGGTLNIAGTGGQNATAHISQFHGDNMRRTFTAAGSRAGDGPINVASGVGAYIAICVTSTGEISQPICFRVTDGAISLHEQVANAIREYILSLALPGVSSNPEQHVVCKIGAKLLSMIENGNDGVYYIPTEPSYEGADNSYVTASLPVNVAIVKRNGQGIVKGLSDVLLCIEDIVLTFEAAPLPDIAGIHSIETRPATLFDQTGWKNGVDITVLQVTAKGEQVDGLL